MDFNTFTARAQERRKQQLLALALKPVFLDRGAATITEPTPKQETAREVLAELVVWAERWADLRSGEDILYTLEEIEMVKLPSLIGKARALLDSLDAQTSGGDTRPHDDELDLADMAFHVGAERMRELCAERVRRSAHLLGLTENNARVCAAYVMDTPLPGSQEEQAQTVVEIDR